MAPQTTPARFWLTFGTQNSNMLHHDINSLIVNNATEPDDVPWTSASHAAVIAAIEKFSSSPSSLLAKQPGLSFFGSPKIGYIAYQSTPGISYALGDPLAAQRDTPFLLRQFIARKKKPAFIQVREHTAKTLNELGLRIMPLGIETEIDMRMFTLDGKDKRDLRGLMNRNFKAGVKVFEQADSPQLRSKLWEISRTWRVNRAVKDREVRFLNRPLSVDPEPDVRIYIGVHSEQVRGFVIFDPIYKDGKVLGYTASQLRASPLAPKGITDAIILTAIQQFVKEGLEILSLGLSPFFRVKEIAAKYGIRRPLTIKVMQLLFDYGSGLYNTKGISFHKQRYRGTEVPVFIGISSLLGTTELLGVLKLCEII